MLSLENLTFFHCGIFAAFYIVVALAIYVYHNEIKGTNPLAYMSLSAGLSHIIVFLLFATGIENRHILIGFASYWTWVPTASMLCIKTAISPEWLTFKRFIKYILFFLIGTIACFISGSIYMLSAMIGISIVSTIWCYFVLKKGIDLHEKLVKEYFTDLERFGNGWIKIFMYFQILTSFCLIYFLLFNNPYFNIIWNYAQSGFWLYFLLKSKEQHYYSTQIPEEYKGDFYELEKKTESISSIKQSEQHSASVNRMTEPNETASVPTQDKSMISQETVEYIVMRLKELEENQYFLDDSLNLSSLAQAVGTNRTYMSVYFRENNTTFWDYINGKRCDYAIELINKQPNITMAELSRKCGYKTENCFRTSFTTIHGKAPSVYKREARLK